MRIDSSRLKWCRIVVLPLRHVFVDRRLGSTDLTGDLQPHAAARAADLLIEDDGDLHFLLAFRTR
jgi:hypothetical protein